MRAAGKHVGPPLDFAIMYFCAPELNFKRVYCEFIV